MSDVGWRMWDVGQDRWRVRNQPNRFLWPRVLLSLFVVLVGPVIVLLCLNHVAFAIWATATPEATRRNWGRIAGLWFGAAGVAVVLEVGAIVLLTRLTTRSRVKAEYACEHCGYDLRGLREPVCPECGMEASAAAARARP